MMRLSSAEQHRLYTRYGSWALITGASSGIGKELAERLAEAGFHVCLVARRKEAADVADMKMGMTLQPSDVGIPILKALGRTSTVLPGFLSQLLVYSLRTVPRWAKVRIMQKIMDGMTRHQRTA